MKWNKQSMNSAPKWKSEVQNSGLRQPVPEGETWKGSDKRQGGGKFFYLCTYFSYKCSLKMFTCYAFLENRLIIYVVLMKFGSDDWQSESHSAVSNSLRLHGLYSPWNSPGQNIGVGSLSLLQVIFPTQGSNPGLPHCRWILYQLS